MTCAAEDSTLSLGSSLPNSKDRVDDSDVSCESHLELHGLPGWSLPSSLPSSSITTPPRLIWSADCCSAASLLSSSSISKLLPWPPCPCCASRGLPLSAPAGAELLLSLIMVEDELPLAAATDVMSCQKLVLVTQTGSLAAAEEL